MRSIVRRGIFLLLSVWFIISVAFFCVYALPGDPARMILGHQASEQSIHEFRERAGLDQPLNRQYLLFLERTAGLNWGNSVLYRRPVLQLIGERSRTTLTLVGCATVVVVLMAFAAPLLVRLSGRHQLGATVRGLSVLVGVAPPYVLAVVMLALFAGWLGWVPVIFDGGTTRAWILPSLVLAAYPVAIVMRLFEGELDGVLRSPYVLRAYASGFTPPAILLREALPNALTAALPGMANSLAAFITGTFFVEVVFGIPGLGRLTYEAISNKDIGLLASLCIVFAVSIAFISALLEVVRLVLDPRLRGRLA